MTPTQGTHNMFTVNLKIAASVLIVTILGGGLGLWIGETYKPRLDAPAVAVGIASGLLFGLALGMLLAHQKRRWIATAALAAFLLVVFITSGWVTTSITVASIAITFIVSAGVLRELYGGNDIQAIKHHFQIWTSIRGGFVVVDNGDIVLPNTPKPHMGPKLIIVRPGNAVVMVNGGSVTRLCGPSVFKSENFEFVDRVINLKRKPRTLRISDVVTASVSTVTLQLSYRYGIDVSESTIRGETAKQATKNVQRGLTTVESNTLQRIVTFHPQWEQEIDRYIEGAARSLLAQYEYGELVGANNYQRLGRRIGLLIVEQIRDLGCVVDLINMISITPNASLMDAHIEGQRVRQLQHAAGDGFRLAITDVAAGYRDAIRLGMSLDDIHREATRFMMEHMTDDPATKVVLTAPPRYTLEDIQGPASIADDAIDGTH